MTQGARCEYHFVVRFHAITNLLMRQARFLYRALQFIRRIAWVILEELQHGWIIAQVVEVGAGGGGWRRRIYLLVGAILPKKIGSGPLCHYLACLWSAGWLICTWQ